MLSAYCMHSVPFKATLHKRNMQFSCRLQSLDVHQQRTSPSSHRRAFSRCVCSASSSSKPEKSAGAIALGLKAYEKADYNEAIGLFKEALTLPGSGIKQYRLALMICHTVPAAQQMLDEQKPCCAAEINQQLQATARRFQLTTTSHVAYHKQGTLMMGS